MYFASPDLEQFISGERLLITYRITGSKTEVAQQASDLIIEQTVEFPEDLIPPGAIREHIFGRIVTITNVSDNAADVDISYAIETVGNEFTQFMTLIFGNISLKPGIRLMKIQFHPFMSSLCKGPRFGITGLRKLTGCFDRPLLCGALKPMGLSPTAIAKMAFDFSSGGIHMLKDDHGLANQPFCNFSERVKIVSDAVHEANAKSGSKTLYAPNITSPAAEIFDKAFYAKERGAGAVLIAPAITGFDTMKSIAENDSLSMPVIAHPAFAGSFTVNPESGISHYALFGQLMRMAGADGSVFPNFGGRFSFSKQECLDIKNGCVEQFGDFKPIFPMPGGGMSVERVPELKKMYGNNVMFLIGGGLFRQSGDLADNVRYFRELAE